MAGREAFICGSDCDFDVTSLLLRDETMIKMLGQHRDSYVVTQVASLSFPPLSEVCFCSVQPSRSSEQSFFSGYDDVTRQVAMSPTTQIYFMEISYVRLVSENQLPWIMIFVCRVTFGPCSPWPPRNSGAKLFAPRPGNECCRGPVGLKPTSGCPRNFRGVRKLENCHCHPQRSKWGRSAERSGLAWPVSTQTDSMRFFDLVVKIQCYVAGVVWNLRAVASPIVPPLPFIHIESNAGLFPLDRQKEQTLLEPSLSGWKG